MSETSEKIFNLGQTYLKGKPYTHTHTHKHRITGSLLQLTLA